jgi:hypothetical protein
MASGEGKLAVDAGVVVLDPLGFTLARGDGSTGYGNAGASHDLLRP